MSLYKRLHARVVHFHFKCSPSNAITLAEFKASNAERGLFQAGGSRQIGRWFSEMGTSKGLVDFPALTAAMVQHGYDGWIVVEATAARRRSRPVS